MMMNTDLHAAHAEATHAGVGSKAMYNGAVMWTITSAAGGALAPVDENGISLRPDKQDRSASFQGVALRCRPLRIRLDLTPRSCRSTRAM